MLSPYQSAVLVNTLNIKKLRGIVTIDSGSEIQVALRTGGYTTDMALNSHCSDKQTWVGHCNGVYFELAASDFSLISAETA